MPEIKSLADYYNPTQQMGNTINLMGLLQQGQRLGLQEQQNQIELERLKKTELLGGLKDVFANPDKFNPETLLQAGNKVNQMLGIDASYTPEQIKQAGPLVASAIDAYEQFGGQSGEFQLAFRRATDSLPPLREAIQKRIASVEATRQPSMARAGLGELAGKVGVSDNPNIQAALASSPQLQTKLGEAAFPSAKDAAQVQHWQAQDKKIEMQLGAISVEGQTLLPVLADAKASVESFKDIQSALPMMATKEEKDVLRATNPRARAFLDALPEQQAATQQKLLELRNHRLGLETEEMKMAFDRTKVTPEQLAAKQAELAATNRAVALNEKKMAYLDNPTPSTYRTWREATQELNTYLTELRTKSGSLDTQRMALQEQKFATEQEYQKKLSSAQADFTQGALTPARAGTIASKYGVLTEDVLKAGKMPNQPLVNISMKQETAESQEVGKAFGKDYADLQKAAVESTNKIAKLDRMEQLLTGVSTGKLTPTMTQIQAIAADLGFKVDASLGPKQAMEALSNEIALTLRNPSGGAGMPGAMSDKDREFLVSMTPNIGKTPEGNKLIIETARKLEKRTQEVARLARTYRKDHGHIDEGFFDVLQEYSDKHPLFDKMEMPAASTGLPAGWSIKPLP